MNSAKLWWPPFDWFLNLNRSANNEKRLLRTNANVAPAISCQTDFAKDDCSELIVSGSVHCCVRLDCSGCGLCTKPILHNCWLQHSSSRRSRPPEPAPGVSRNPSGDVSSVSFSWLISPISQIAGFSSSVRHVLLFPTTTNYHPLGFRFTPDTISTLGERYFNATRIFCAFQSMGICLANLPNAAWCLLHLA